MGSESVWAKRNWKTEHTEVDQLSCVCGCSTRIDDEIFSRYYFLTFYLLLLLLLLHFFHNLIFSLFHSSTSFAGRPLSTRNTHREFLYAVLTAHRRILRIFVLISDLFSEFLWKLWSCAAMDNIVNNTITHSVNNNNISWSKWKQKKIEMFGRWWHFYSSFEHDRQVRTQQRTNRNNGMQWQ